MSEQWLSARRLSVERYRLSMSGPSCFQACHQSDEEAVRDVSEKITQSTLPAKYAHHTQTTTKEKHDCNGDVLNLMHRKRVIRADTQSFHPRIDSAIETQKRALCHFSRG